MLRYMLYLHVHNTYMICACCSLSPAVMFEIELISFVDHNAADSYAAFTPVSAQHLVMGTVTGIHGNRKKGRMHQLVSW